MNAFPRVISYYDMPNAATTYEDLERLRHDDLRAMDARDLYVERLRVERAITRARGGTYVTTTQPPYFMPAIDWLVDRIRHVRDELAKRGGRSGR